MPHDRLSRLGSFDLGHNLLVGGISACNRLRMNTFTEDTLKHFNSFTLVHIYPLD